MRTLLTLFTFLLLAGCVNVNKTIKLHEANEQTPDKVVTLFPPFQSKVAMELFINGEKAGESCGRVCPFIQPLELLPGQYRFASNNMHRDYGLEFETDIPFTKTQVFEIKVVSISPQTISFRFETLYTLEQGKSYTLQLGSTTDKEGTVRYYAWWLEVVKT